MLWRNVMQQKFPAVNHQTSVALIHCVTKYWGLWNTCRRGLLRSDLQCGKSWLHKWTTMIKTLNKEAEKSNLQYSLHTSTQTLQHESTFSCTSSSKALYKLITVTWIGINQSRRCVCVPPPPSAVAPLISAPMFLRALEAWKPALWSQGVEKATCDVLCSISLTCKSRPE